MRTDVHAPASAEFDPTLYACEGVFDNDLDSRAISAVSQDVEAEGFKLGKYNRFQCGHCGTHLRYCALMTREDVKEYIFVGEDCLDNRFSGLTKAQFQAKRKAAQLSAERNKVREAVAAQCEQVPALAWLTYPQATSHFDNGFISDIAAKFVQYGTLSVRQVEAVLVAMDRATARFDVAAAKAAQLAPEVAPAPTGKHTVTGEVVHTKIQDGFYGTEYKMLVVTADGWKFWGTIPRSLIFALDRISDLKGKQITLTANFTPKPDDVSFAFANRPIKAMVLAA